MNYDSAKKRLIQTSVIGSRLFNQANEDSDLDLFAVYVDHTEDVLTGRAACKSFNNNGDIFYGNQADLHLHEAGKVVEQLLKGNINYIIGVSSPICKQYSWGKDLQNIVKQNPAKNIFHSINGLVTSQVQRYAPVKNTAQEERRAQKIGRYLQFGLDYLALQEPVFNPTNVRTLEEVKYQQRLLQEVYDDSTLPEEPDDKPFLHWLYQLRLAEHENPVKKVNIDLFVSEYHDRNTS